MLMRVSRAAISALVIFPVVLPAYGLTSQEIVAKLEAAGYSQIREMKSGKIMTYKAASMVGLWGEGLASFRFRR